MDMRSGDCGWIGLAPGTLSCALASAAVKVSCARSAGRASLFNPSAGLSVVAMLYAALSMLRTESRC